MADTAELKTLLSKGEGLFYMKVGTHAGEPIDQIVERKQAEITRNGFTLWGYGGSNCHPLTIVQPFAAETARDGHFRLVMEETHATHFAVDRVATEYSVDGVHWEEIPDQIAVRGSRYALIIDSLSWTDVKLQLGNMEVVLGPSSGRRGDAYISGLNDKACLKVTETRDDPDAETRKITLIATVREPYAVFVREKLPTEGMSL